MATEFKISLIFFNYYNLYNDLNFSLKPNKNEKLITQIESR